MKTSRRNFLKSVLALAVTGTVQPKKLWTGWGPSPVYGAIQTARTEVKIADEWIDIGGLGGFGDPFWNLGKAARDFGIECQKLVEIIHATNETLQDNFPYVPEGVDISPGKRVVVPVLRSIQATSLSDWENIALNEPVFDYITLEFRRMVPETGVPYRTHRKDSE